MVDLTRHSPRKKCSWLTGTGSIHQRCQLKHKGSQKRAAAEDGEGSISPEFIS